MFHFLKAKVMMPDLTNFYAKTYLFVLHHELLFLGVKLIWIAGQPASKSKIIPGAIGLICLKQTRLQSLENAATQFIMQTLCRSPQLILIVCRFKKIRRCKADIDSREGK